MRKLLLLLTLSGVLMLTLVSTLNAQTLTEESLMIQGFSPYMSKIALLQVKKHEKIPYEKPDRVDTVFKHIFVWGDWLMPTQEFGYYDISVRD